MQLESVRPGGMRARTSSRSPLATRYRDVRDTTARLCRPLAVEDYVVQTMPDVSPTKWHLAHTTWFFETFVLGHRTAPRHDPFDTRYAVLFNSYYNAVGEQYPRHERGLLSRPTVDEVWRYREHVDEAMCRLIEGLDPDGELARIVELGLHHEQQHQELMVTDIKHVLAHNPLEPSYGAGFAATEGAAPTERVVSAMGFVHAEPGLVEVGHRGEGFCFDNELPRHRTFLAPFELGTRLVTCGEYLAFMQDGGYGRPELWLSEGWSWREREAVEAPLYWRRGETGWRIFTLAGARALRADEPVVHVSLYEADAYARWAGARLPREHELEVVSRAAPLEGNFLDSGALHPRPARDDGSLAQLHGDGWEWTQSAYTAYPGYAPPQGALGEYNGKFMCNQHVLRGGSCATARSHMRPTYRNFFPASARWQFTCIRLAKDPTS